MNVPTGTEYDPNAPWNERPERMRICWNCEGSGVETNLVPIKGLIDAFREVETECSACQGAREMPEDDAFYN